MPYKIKIKSFVHKYNLEILFVCHEMVVIEMRVPTLKLHRSIEIRSDFDVITIMMCRCV